MNQPQAYSEGGNMQRKPILHVLENYLPLIRWKEDSACIMDVGCGPGDVTVDTLLPLLPSNYKKLVACDRSTKMIDYARTKFEEQNVEFTVLDLEHENISKELERKFDHIFSFFCLQWVNNQRQAFVNLNSMLKTGGDMLLTFLADVSVFHTYTYLYQTEKWRRHMKDFDKYTFPYMHAKDPEKELREILDSTEFNIKVCKVLEGNFSYKSRNSMKLAMQSVNPYVLHMNENDREDFMEDLIETELTVMDCKDKDGEILQPYKIFVVVAEKKNNLDI